MQSGRGRGRELDRGNEVFVVVGVVVMVVVVLAVMVAVMVLEVVVVLAVVARLPAMRFLGYGHAGQYTNSESGSLLFPFTAHPIPSTSTNSIVLSGLGFHCLHCLQMRMP